MKKRIFIFSNVLFLAHVVMSASGGSSELVNVSVRSEVVSPPVTHEDRLATLEAFVGDLIKDCAGAKYAISQLQKQNAQLQARVLVTEEHLESAKQKQAALAQALYSVYYMGKES